MRRFEIIKTLQLILFAALTAIALFTVFRDQALYQAIASNPHIRLLSLILWIVLGLSFLFMFFDFGSYTDLKRENTELDHAVYSDALTGVANRYSCDAYLNRYLNKELPKDMGCITFDLVNLGEINAHEGHEGGDAAIRDFADILTEASRHGIDPEDFFVGRNGGNKFLTIIRHSSGKKLVSYIDTVKKMVDEAAQHGEVLKYTFGRAFAGTEDVKSITELVALSDKRAMMNEDSAPALTQSGEQGGTDTVLK